MSNLSAGYRKGGKEVTVLQGIGLTLQCGSLVCFLGANGAGKSTLLRTISGLQMPLEGEILLKGKPLSKYTPKQRSKLVSIVSTDRTFAGGLTVKELVGLGRQPHTGFLGKLGPEDRYIVDESIQAVGISYKANSFISELSDGERQKTMIARALAQEAPIILLDEPTAFLDVASRIEILQLLHRLTRERQKAILFSSHDIAQSLAMSDRLWLLANGTITDRMTEDAVLGGYMDTLFPQQGLLEFDFKSGDFAIRQTGGKPVAVESRSPELKHWCTRALIRNGYCIDSSASVCVHIKAPTSITIVDGERVETAGSIESLLATLLR